MGRNSYSIIFLVIIANLLLFPAAGLAAGRMFILGVDESGSYALRETTMKIVEDLIMEEMQPGDILFGRRITDKSYPDTPENLLLPSALQLPEVGAANKNRFNLVAKKKRAREKKRVEIVRLAAIKHIRTLQPVNAPNTDIYGFLAACSDRLTLADGGLEKIVVIASDMVDNCRRKVPVNLAGARVVILAFQKSEDPAKTMELREIWNKRLLEMQASAVVFLSPDQDLRLALPHTVSN